MKKKLLAAGLTVALFITGIGATKASAATYYDFDNNVKPVFVQNVDNNQYPQTDKYYIYDSVHRSAKFEITKPAVVKAYYTWDNTGSTKVSGNAWFSYDAYGVDTIGAKTKISQPQTSAVVFLDPGKYYINQEFTVKNGNTATSTFMGMTLIIEEVDTDEAEFSTSFDNPNYLAEGTDAVGFVSNNAPNDYYVFSVSEYSLVNITFNFLSRGGVSANKGTCTLYDENKRIIQTKTFSATGYNQNIISQYLDKGTYFICLGGTTAPTYIRKDTTSYAISIVTPEKAMNGNVEVKVNTDIDAAEIVIVPQKVSDSKVKDSSVWSTRNGMTDITEDRSFVAPENATYTVRIKDKNNSYVMKTFSIKCIDKTAPVISGVPSGTSNKAVKLTITDENLSKITLNGKKVTLSGLKKVTNGYELEVSEDGKNKVVAYDSADNKTKVTVKIKK